MSETITTEERLLLNRHLRHSGIYARIAKKLKVDTSFVSGVPSGDLKSAKIQRAVQSIRRLP
jgi:hypothetical protein